MRVIAGKYRSRQLHSLRGAVLRPTSDRLRETLFNILAPILDDAIFVDLFAGSGAVGIEALSRGARLAIFVEKQATGVALIRRNLESLGIPIARPDAAERPKFSGAAEILRLDALAGIKRLLERDTRADIIFADPPYAESSAYGDVLDIVGNSELLAAGGMMVLEHSSRAELPTTAGALERIRLLRQGDSTLSFYRCILAA